MEVVTLEVAQGWCRDYEATLRASFRPDPLPAELEAQLAGEPPQTVRGAIRRYALLKHLYWQRYAEKNTRASKPDAALAARELLRREPVRVQVAGETVAVTGRSYAAWYCIAAHAARIRSLEVSIDRVAGVLAELEARPATRLPILRTLRASRIRRRRTARLYELQRKLYREMVLHRRALYAHALTPDGAPAREPLSEAPEWCDRVTPEDEARMLVACYEAGPGRYARLGRTKGKSDQASDDYGWASFFASIERSQRVAPALYYDVDLYQLIAWTRAGVEPAPEDIGG